MAELTTAQLGRKLAVLIDGEVRAAPIVLGVISGGQLILTVEDETTGAAEAVAAGLTCAAVAPPR